MKACWVRLAVIFVFFGISAHGDYLTIKNGTKFQCGRSGCYPLFIDSNGQFFYVRGRRRIPAEYKIAQAILEQSDYRSNNLPPHKARAVAFYSKKEEASTVHRPSTSPAQAPSTLTHQAERVKERPLASPANKEVFDGRELLSPSTTDAGAYYEFARKIFRWNCRTPGDTQIVSSIPAPELSLHQETAAVAKEGSAIIDMLETLRREGTAPSHIFVDISYGQLRPGEKPVDFQSANPRYANFVIVAGAGVTIDQLRDFFRSKDSRRRFSESARKREALQVARDQDPQYQKLVARSALACRTDSVPRPYGAVY